MNMAQEPQGASRFTGIGVVIVVHAVMIAGLSTGLVQRIIKPPPVKTEARVIEEEIQPPPPPRRVQPEDPTRKIVIERPEPLQPPDVSVVTPTDIVPGTTTTSTLQTGHSTDPGPTIVTQAVVKPTVATTVTPGMVCTKMGKPDLPAVNWAGDALFRVQATVRAGRVAATEFTVLSGVMDPKTRRALQAAIANTLRDTYECPGEHRFEQEFNVRID